MKNTLSRCGWTWLLMLVLCGVTLAQPPQGGTGQGRRGGVTPLPGAGRGARSGGPPASGLEQAVNNLNLTGSKRQIVTAEVRAYEANLRALTDLASAELVMKMKAVVTPDDFKKLTQTVAGLRTSTRGNGTPVVTEDDLVARVLAYDKSGLGKVSKDDLPERMQDLIAKGDGNGDQVLDQDEIKNLATDRPTTPTRRRGGRGAANGGNAAVPAGARNPIPVAVIGRAISDLNLSGHARETATVMVKSAEDTLVKLKAMARADLLLKVSDVLSEAELMSFSALLDRPAQPGSNANVGARRDGRGARPGAPPQGGGRGPGGRGPVGRGA